MQSISRKFLGAVVGLSAALAVAGSAAAAGSMVQEQLIRELDAKWVAAVAAKDAAAVAEFYAADGMFLAPNAPLVEGRKGIAEAWAGLLGLPGISLTFEPTRIEVSESADLASDVGTYSLAFDGEGGRVRDQGKYVVVWKKENGAWKILADIFNSNLPAQ
jgi:uncharacterized protein (TIGR02246 family)